MNAFDQYPKLLCSFHCHSRKYLSHSQGVQFIQSTSQLELLKRLV
jgi:hypothetical protein